MDAAHGAARHTREAGMDRHHIYRTPVGSFETWEDAAAAVERRDMDPTTCVEVVRLDPPHDVCWEFGPGGPLRLSFAVRCF